MSSSEFYDNFVNYQLEAGINDRVYQLYKRLCKLGLSSNDKVLEIGCGIGALTHLLSLKVKKGQIEAVDFSEKSIEFAKANLTKPNLLFSSANILDYEPTYFNFDKILLFDVLEHIPEENHLELFTKINMWMNNNNESLILINIPNPNYILYDQKYNPKALQEIDQPIHIHTLTQTLAKASLELEYFETYSVWVKNDYQFLMIKKKNEFQEQRLSSERNLIEKIKVRLKRDLRKMIYNYPKIKR
jgi:trans-aconitate 2-methyltransferase